MEYKRKTLSGPELDYERQRFTHYATERSGKLDTRAKEAWELAHNARDGTETQYTADQLNALNDVGFPHVSLNFIHPIVSHQVATLTETKPIGRVVPTDDGDKAKAAIYERVLDAIWRKSKTSAAYSKAIKEMLICYISGMIIEPSSFYREGAFDLTISHVPFDDIYIDPDARESGLNFRDAECIYIAKLVPQRKVKNIFGVTIDDEFADTLIKAELFTRNEEMNNRYVLVRDCYEKKAGYLTLLHGVNPDTKQTEAYRKVFPSRKALEAAVKGQGFKAVDIRDGVYVNRRLILGEKTQMLDVLLPLTDPPLALLTYDDYHNPFGKSGVEYLRELQKARNKFWQIVILNAMLASNTRFMGPEGSFVDKDMWTKYGATAGHTYEYRAMSELPNGGKPEIVQPLPLNAAFYQLQEQMEGMGEYIMGTWKPQMGNMSSAPDNVGGTQAILSAGTARLKELKSRISMAVAMGIWRPGIQYINHYGNRGQIIRYLDEMDELQEVALDDILNDYEIQEWDVQISVKNALPTDRERLLQIMQTLISQTQDPNIQRLAFEESLNLQDWPITDKLLKKIDTVTNLTAQLEQMQQTNQKLTQMLEGLQREMMLSDRANQQVEMAAERQVQSADFAAKAAMAQQAMQQQTPQPTSIGEV